MISQADGNASPLLAVDAVTKRFGGVVALEAVSFEMGEAAVVGLIGPNGSGKTTLLNTINGVLRPDAGEIRLRNGNITGRNPSDLAAAGLSRTFQNARVFRTLTVEQNLLTPLLHASDIVRKTAAERAVRLLSLVSLEQHAERPASELSGGQQKLLEFARALVTRPRLVLMDEPFAGVHPEIKAMLVHRIREIVEEEGTSFLVVSHEVPDLVDLSSVMLCLVEGRVITTGAPAKVVRDDRVVEAYLGRARAPQ